MKFRSLAAILLLTSSLAACDRVPVGSVGIKVNNLGGDKGVNEEVLGTGWYWVGLTKTMYTFPTFMQTRKWEDREAFSFQTADGMVVGAPVSISYQVEPEKVPTLFQTYRKGLDEITDIYIHNIIRDALVVIGGTRSVDDVYGAGKGRLLADVQKMVSDKLSPMGIKVDQVSLVGPFELPASVITAINAKINATQQAQQRENEVATAKAEAQKAVAEAQGKADSISIKAKGDADATITNAQSQAKANQLLSQSLTPELVQYNTIEKWNGQLPSYMMGGAVPFVNVTPGK